MIHESGWLQLGEPLVVGAKVLSPSCAMGPLLSTFFFFASSFSWLDLRKALHCGGHRGLVIRHPRLTVRTTTPPRHVEVVWRVWDWVVQRLTIEAELVGGYC